jgi:hypothetical protein
MPRTCIICGNRAGSAEHIFPAGLGGRRTNRGIYCGPHNNGFSGFAAPIVQQLKPINALLAVRQDHSKTAEPVAYTSPEGEALVIFDGAVTAKADRPPSGDVHHIGLMFGGPNGLQAIAYIALTFFAHYFREHSRKAGAQPIKTSGRRTFQTSSYGGKAIQFSLLCPQINIRSAIRLHSLPPPQAMQ